MKARFIIIAAIAIITLGLTSCEKNDTKTFKVTAKQLRSMDKTHVSGTNIVWDDGDVININVNRASVEQQPDNSFKITAGAAVDGGYYAAYPYGEWAYGSRSYNNPNTNLNDLPMFAYASSDGGSTLTFGSPYAVIRLIITNDVTAEPELDITPETFTSATLTVANKVISGIAQIDLSSGNPTIGEVSSTADNTTKATSIEPNNDDSIDFYILPCSGNGNITVMCNGVFEKTASGAYNFQAGTIYPIYVTLNNECYNL